MNKKEIQAERKKGYFIEAAKKIVRKEGVDNLTVKKIADAAGYAQGTLYNYFENLDRLLFYCVEDFFTECKEFVVNNTADYTTVQEKVINSAKAYSNYFLHNPNVYRLIFLEDLGTLPEEKGSEQGYTPEIIKLLRSILEDCVQEQIIKQDEVKIVGNLIGNSIHGNLLFFINQKTQLTEEELLQQIEDEVNYLLKK